jgi:hypothetical protein
LVFGRAMAKYHVEVCIHTMNMEGSIAQSTAERDVSVLQAVLRHWASRQKEGALSIQPSRVTKSFNKTGSGNTGRPAMGITTFRAPSTVEIVETLSVFAHDGYLTQIGTHQNVSFVPKEGFVAAVAREIKRLQNDDDD